MRNVYLVIYAKDDRGIVRKKISKNIYALEYDFDKGEVYVPGGGCLISSPKKWRFKCLEIYNRGIGITFNDLHEAEEFSNWLDQATAEAEETFRLGLDR